MATGTAAQGADDDGRGGADQDNQRGGISAEDDERRAVQARQEEPVDTRPTYDPAQFAKNLPVWQGLVSSGKKSARAVIATIETKGAPLTEAQKAAITGAAA